MGEKKKKSRDFFEIIIIIGLCLFLVAIFLFNHGKERSVGDLLSQTQEQHNRMMLTNLGVAKNDLKGFSEGTCGGTILKLEHLKKKTQNPEELAKIEQLLEKICAHQVQTKVMVEELQKILNESGAESE